MARRWAARVDANQPAIVKALRTAGASVQSLADVGKGVPDLLVGYKGATYLVEVKDPDAARGKAQATQLTPAQAAWFAAWRGLPVIVAQSPDEAVEALTGRTGSLEGKSHEQ